MEQEKIWFTKNYYFLLITIVFGMVVTDVWKAHRCRLNNRDKEKTLGIWVFVNILDGEILKNLE